MSASRDGAPIVIGGNFAEQSGDPVPLLRCQWREGVHDRADVLSEPLGSEIAGGLGDRRVIRATVALESRDAGALMGPSHRGSPVQA